MPSTSRARTRSASPRPSRPKGKPRSKSSTSSRAPTAPKPKKKRGPKGDFHGQRLAFLESKLAEYQNASKNGEVQSWYNDVLFPAYWSRFHWSLAIDVEPSPNDVYPEESSLNREELDAKTEQETHITKKIKTWFNYRRHQLGLVTNEVWQSLLDIIRQGSITPPHRLRDYQYYMQLPEYKKRIGEVFDIEWPSANLDDSHQLSFRCEIAKRLLEDEEPEIQAALKKQAEEDYQAALEKFEKGLIWDEVEDPEARQQAIDTLCSVMQPLLDGIRAHTGLFVQLTVALPREDPKTVQCISIGSGTSADGKGFADMDVGGFRKFSTLFIRYAMVAAGYLDPSVFDESKQTPTEAPATEAQVEQRLPPRRSYQYKHRRSSDATC
ncbi:hypothetical protein ONZ45_g13099 [Pleurotus djamor]|nr:hypothetical protein ONZ45_g13099 [Pleurotus djamor]